MTKNELIIIIREGKEWLYSNTPEDDGLIDLGFFNIENNEMLFGDRDTAMSILNWMETLIRE
jgi:hypothetical protein